MTERRRQSQFPQRPTVIHRRESGFEPREGVHRGIFLTLGLTGLFIVLGAGLLWLWSDPFEGESPTTASRVTTSPKTPKPVSRSLNRTPQESAPPAVEVGGSEEVVTIPIGLGFRPAGFKIGAVPQRLRLFSSPDRLFKRMPVLGSGQRRYGVLQLGEGREHRLLLEQTESGFRLHFDFNRNGDFLDDGDAIESRNPDGFAAAIGLPLDRVTGIAALKGEYKLWLFTSRGDTMTHLNYYVMTQLKGQLRLGTHLVTAYLAENVVIDGDYRNDGISLDLDDDGSIDREREFIPPGAFLELGDSRLRFDITP